MIHADAWFTMGHSHLVCQDFALAGSDEGRAWAVVCDGCSSSPHTDVGARLLAFAAAESLRRGVLPGAQTVRQAALTATAIPGLPSRSLDATLMALLADPAHTRVRVWGDGVVLARRRDGTIVAHVFSQAEGAPPYPSYLLDDARADAWRAACTPGVRLERFEIHPELQTIASRKIEHREAVVDLEFSAVEYSVVGVASDGLTSLLADDPEGRAPEWARVFARVFAFPQRTGRFVTRRGRRFIGRECPSFGWTPMDDVALAAVAHPFERRTDAPEGQAYS